MFRAGKNQDGWFASEDLLLQVDEAINVFEGCAPFATSLFLLTMLLATKNEPQMPF